MEWSLNFSKICVPMFLCVAYLLGCVSITISVFICVCLCVSVYVCVSGCFLFVKRNESVCLLCVDKKHLGIASDFIPLAYSSLIQPNSQKSSNCSFKNAFPVEAYSCLQVCVCICSCMYKCIIHVCLCVSLWSWNNFMFEQKQLRMNNGNIKINLIQ